MKVIIILAVIMIGAPLVYNFPTLLFLLAPAIFFLITKDKAGAAIENFFAIGFAIIIIGGIVKFIREVLM